MEIVRPLPVQAEAASAGRFHHPRVIQVALRDEGDPAPRLLGKAGRCLRQLRQERRGALVEDAVDRVEPQGVDMVALEPVQGVLDKEVAHLVAVRAVEIDGRAPRGPVPVGEIGAEIRQVVPFGPQMVVHDVEDDREARPWHASTSFLSSSGPP